jgi:plastocyanin
MVMKLRPALVVALALGLVLALAGCGSSASPTTGQGAAPSTTAGGTSGTGGTTVTEQNFAFDPQTLTVKVGDTVTFTNADSAPHNVKIDGQELGSQNQGESKTWKATKAGSFPYICTVHPSMTGQITVQ